MSEFIWRMVAAGIGVAIAEFLFFLWRAKRKERNERYDR